MKEENEKELKEFEDMCAKEDEQKEFANDKKKREYQIDVEDYAYDSKKEKIEGIWEKAKNKFEPNSK